MKTKTLLLLLCAYLMTAGYGYASAEDTLPPYLKDLIKENKAAEVEKEAAKFSQAGNDFLAALAYGEACLLKSDPDKAEASFRKALEINPIGIEGKIGLAKTLVFRKETEKAMQMLRDALRTSPHPVRIYYEMGLILEASGNLKGAARAFEQGLERHFSEK